MGASPTRPRADTAPPRRIAVAASGGRDSTALLHCTARLARDLGIEVLALHVHHGLMPRADDWTRHLQAQCRRWARSGLPVLSVVHRVTSTPPPGASVEAWARKVRYAALEAMARNAGVSAVLLAHHRRDQAETFLLQALRGGAERGLAGMPAVRRSGAMQWLRPWLAMPREAIDAYLARHRLSWVDDQSNADTRFARGALRQMVWPTLQRAFPQAEITLAGAARRSQEAAECLAALARIDLAERVPDPESLDLAAVLSLPEARAINALRHGLAQLLGESAPQSLIDRLLSEGRARAARRWPAPGGRELRLHDGLLRLGDVDAGLIEMPTARLDLQQPGRYELANDLGALIVTPVGEGGAALRDLAQVELRGRRGGERFQFEPGSLPRSLKKQFQAWRVPAWARNGPLLYTGDRLLFVPGLGIDARVRAPAGERQMALAWTPPALR